MYNRVREYINVTRKYNSNSIIRSIQYKIFSSVFTYLKPIYNNYNTSIVESYSTEENDSVKVSNYYKEKNREKLKQMLEDPEKLELYNKLKLEIERLQHTDYRIPDTLTEIDWIKLLLAPTKSQRRKCLEYRWKTEKSIENDVRKKEIKNKETFEKYLEIGDDHLAYTLNRNAMFIRFSRSMMNNFYNKRLFNAMIFEEPKIVFDVGYDEYMTTTESLNCGKQLLFSFALNRAHPDPFDLYFCNVKKDSFTMQHFHKAIPTMYDDDFPLTVTEKSYLDLFNAEDLVYLTPDAHYTLREFNPNLVYIIGGLVDKYNKKSLSLAAAKKARIKMYKLPLSEYNEWGSGSAKNLPINQVLAILLDLRYTNSWHKAMNNIPTRKLRPARLKNMERKINARKDILESLMKES